MTFRNERRRKSFFPKIFGTREKKAVEMDELSLDPFVGFEECPVLTTNGLPFLRKRSSGCVSINYSFPSLQGTVKAQVFRIFVATWNVGGKPPHSGLKLNNFIPADDHSDIYVLGFQEVVPLNAGNVLVIEDNEPAAKWLALINQALNKQTEAYLHTPSRCTNSFSSQAFSLNSSISRDMKNTTSPLFLQKSDSRTFNTEQDRWLKTCNCPPDNDSLDEEEEVSSSFSVADMAYIPIASKQMVGIFLTVWVRKELVQHIGHLRLSCVGRGIMGCLGNKGCISVSMSLHQTSFCFVCSHLASGEKERDELRRNSDVTMILKNTRFQKIGRSPSQRIPQKILEHDRVIWLGDLNYRIALSYPETRKLLEGKNWDALLEKDQLKIERETGRVFKGWNEEDICFPPTYKYSNNSDAYAGESETSKKKRRTPAWCDRILWHGNGIKQLSYFRGESRFSDHRPVCAVFRVQVDVLESRLSTDLYTSLEELLASRNSYYS